MRDYHSKFEPEKYYHIFNRGNNGDNIFVGTDNYRFFLSRWMKYVQPFTKTFAYCLMPNHFHFLIKINPDKCFTQLFEYSKTEPSDVVNDNSYGNPSRIWETEDININHLLENQFKKLFSSYALSFNKQQNRHGSLFEKRFKRVIIDSDSYFSKIIHYIHNNPIHHQFKDDYSWEFSSYRSFISSKPSLLAREEVFQWFGGKEAFITFHDVQIDYREIKDIAVDWQ